MFTVASLVCGLAPSAAVLIVGRVVQGEMAMHAFAVVVTGFAIAAMLATVAAYRSGQVLQPAERH